MVATSVATAERISSRSPTATRLSDLVRSAQADADAARPTRDDLAAQLQDLQVEAAQSDAGVAEALAQTRRDLPSPPV